MTQSGVNLPPAGTGDTGVKAAVKKLSTGESVQQIELVTAVDGGAATAISSGNPLEVAIVGTVPISGAPTTVTANLGTIGGAATQTTLAAVLSALGTPLQAGGNVAVTSSALPTGAATQTTLASLLAKTPAIGTAGSSATDVITVQGIASGTAQPISAASLPLPSGAATETTLAAVNTKLGGTLTVTGGGTPADLTASGTVTASGNTVAITSMNGMSTCNVQVAGTYVATLFVELTIDGSTWFSPAGYGQPINDPSGLIFTVSSFASAAQTFQLNVAGAVGVRLRCSAYTSGTATINLRASAGGHITALGASLPTGINVIGAVKSQPIQSGSATLTQVAGSASSVTLFAATTRTGLVIVNDSTASLKVAFAATATTSAYTYLLTAGQTLELPTAGRVMYNGAISGIWASATGSAVLTEIT